MDKTYHAGRQGEYLMKREIKNATAIYTGGGIYIYYGQLTDGNYFRASDCEDFIEICNSDTSVEAADYTDFYKKHRIETLTNEAYKIFWDEMLQWIIDNVPEGNYQISELVRRIISSYRRIREITYVNDNTCIICHKETGEKGVASVNDKGVIWVFYGADDGSDDKEMTEEEFDKTFEIIGEE